MVYGTKMATTYWPGWRPSTNGRMNRDNGDTLVVGFVFRRPPIASWSSGHYRITCGQQQWQQFVRSMLRCSELAVALIFATMCVTPVEWHVSYGSARSHSAARWSPGREKAFLSAADIGNYSISSFRQQQRQRRWLCALVCCATPWSLGCGAISIPMCVIFCRHFLPIARLLWIRFYLLSITGRAVVCSRCCHACLCECNV